MPSSFSGFFSRVATVVTNQVFHSGQANKLAKTINQRILSGLADVHWRSLYAAHSLVRNFRRPNAAETEYAPEDEWHQLYGLYEETDWDWPSAAAGDPEGLSKDCPIVGYFFGPQSGSSFEDEQTRTDEVPLRDPPAGPAPTTVLEKWDLGKLQRGAITAADLTDFSKAPAMNVARLMEDVNSSIGQHDPKHKTLGGKIKDSSDEFIHEKGQQWNQMRTYFAGEWRGTNDEREDAGDWDPKELTVGYEEMLDGQWFLSPSYGVSVGSLGAVSAEYPLFEWSTGAAVGTYGSVGGGDNVDNHTNFSFVGFILVGENLSSSYRTVSIEIDGVQVDSLWVNDAAPEMVKWFPVPHKGNLKVKLLDTLQGSEDVWVEVAELLDHKPEVFDVYLFVRMMNARGSTPSIYRGKIVSDAKDISDEYFASGMILNGTNADVPAETKLAKFAPYQAVRDFLVKFFRMINYDRLVGYYVNGSGNSVLVFDRRGKGDADADIFQELAPQEFAVTKIKEGCLYEIGATGAGPTGDVEYDGNDYKLGETFRGTEVQDFDLGSSVDLGVFEKDWLIDIDSIPKNFRSNEWVLSIGGQTVYKDTAGATYKPDAYGDILGAFHDRCHTFSEALVSAGSKEEEFNKFVTSGTGITDAKTEQTIIQRAESPPGYRYEGNDVPYYGAGLVNDLIDALDDPTTIADCRDSIFEEYVSGGTPVEDLGAGDCDGISAHFESCKVFKAPYMIKSVKQEGSNINYVEVELDGRLERSSSAPSSIADTSASRSTYLSTDTGPRTDENTVVGLLRWKVDGVDDEDRVGDISPNAQSPDYDTTEVKGAVLCRFFLQRLMPHVYDDADIDIQPERDTKPIAQYWQYAEFIIRASIGGFLDEQRVKDTLTYHAATPSYHSFCDSQDSRDLTMARVLSLIGSTDDRMAIRHSGQSRGGYGILPNTRWWSDFHNEMANVLNLLSSSRFGVPIYLESRTITYGDFKEVDITLDDGFSIIEFLAWEEPATVTNTGAWGQATLPFSDASTAYSTILDDGVSHKAFFFKSVVEWRVRPHPKVLEAVPDALKNYVDLNDGIGTPILIQDPILKQVDKLKDPDPGDTIDDVGEIDVIEAPTERCDIGQSGRLEPGTPPNGPVIGVTANIDTTNGAELKNSAESSIQIETIGEAYIRVPIQ